MIKLVQKLINKPEIKKLLKKVIEKNKETKKKTKTKTSTISKNNNEKKGISASILNQSNLLKKKSKNKKTLLGA